MKFRNAFSDSCRDSDLGNFEPSLAQQQYRDDSDINVLLERFKVTGQMPSGVRLPQYGDYSQVEDFRTSLDTITAARDEFMKIPAKLRARFENSPQQFLEFCADPANLPELQKLGLANSPPAKQDPPPAPPVSPT